MLLHYIPVVGINEVSPFTCASRQTIQCSTDCLRFGGSYQINLISNAITDSDSDSDIDSDSDEDDDDDESSCGSEMGFSLA
eukprot:scaffold3819_cov98-Skeletonema_dohrnii-CCMP3373.AAC.8